LKKKEGKLESNKIIVYADPDISDLIPGFLENRQKEIKTISEALDKKEFDTIRIIGHSMKGYGAGYGFDELSDIGAALEKAAEKEATQGIQKEFARLETYLRNVQVVYK